VQGAFFGRFILPPPSSRALRLAWANRSGAWCAADG
jgi:hypothetical protein